MARRRPQRSPLARPLGGWATVRDQLDNTHYMISIGSRVSMAVIGFYSGAQILRKGERVLVTWREEARLWHIKGAGGSVALAPSRILVSLDDGDFRIDTTAYRSGANELLVARGVASTAVSNAWMRFENIAVAQGSVVGNATLHMTTKLRSLGGTHNVYCNDEDNATAPVDHTEAIAKTKTVAFGSFSAGGGVNDIDVTDAVNEVFARGGWASGNALMFLAESPGITQIRYYSVDEIVGERWATLNIQPERVPTEQLVSTDLSDFEEI